jgi:hypothetical protein
LPAAFLQLLLQLPVLVPGGLQLVLQSLQGLVLRREQAIALLLLLLMLRLQLSKLPLQIGQFPFEECGTAQIRPVGGPLQVGQHMDIAQRTIAQFGAAVPVTEQGPEGTGQLAGFHGVMPERFPLRCPMQLSIGLYPALILGIQQLLQASCGRSVLLGQAHQAGMQLIVAVPLGQLETALSLYLAQFAHRQAGTDNRAVHIEGELPEFQTPGASWVRNRTGAFALFAHRCCSRAAVSVKDLG